MSYDLPPVVKLAESLLVQIEEAVHRWPRYHKYAHGVTLRSQAMEVAQLAHRAWRDRRQQLTWLNELVWAVDELKLSLQLGMKIRAFSSFRQFEVIAKGVKELGRQVGGWVKHEHSKGQNAAPRVGAPQRPQILSTRATSAEGNQ